MKCIYCNRGISRDDPMIEICHTCWDREKMLKALKKLISDQDKVGGDYDSLYFGLKELIE